jgi:S1-C subfamily serine protease
VKKTGPRQFLGPVCFSLLLFSPLPALAQSVQEALLRAKPAAALVVSEVSAFATIDCDGQQITSQPSIRREPGSGWFVDPAGWLITSAHVVSSAYEPPAAGASAMRDSAVEAACLRLILARRGLAPGARPEVEDQISRRLATTIGPKTRMRFERSISVVLANGRRLPARVVKYSPPPAGSAMSGRDLALLKVEAEPVPTLPLGDPTKAKIGDRLHVIGFPNVVMSHELLNASARIEASVSGGAISGFKEDVNGQPVFQTDASAAGGDSGGPVVNDRGEVMGVMTFVSDATGGTATVQGFNFIIPSAAVRDFLKGTGVALGEPGKFSRAWAAGLATFFAGDYPGARPHLAEANRLVPDLPDVQRITAENEERIKNPPPRRFPWGTTGAVLTLLGALGCAVAWMEWWKRNRFRVRPRDVARQLDTGETGPVILDVRDSDTYRKSPVRIPSALHVPAERLESGETTVPVDSNRAVVAYCT